MHKQRPQYFQLDPPVNFTEVTTPNGEHVITIKSLAPREWVSSHASSSPRDSISASPSAGESGFRSKVAQPSKPGRHERGRELHVQTMSKARRATSAQNTPRRVPQPPAPQAAGPGSLLGAKTDEAQSQRQNEFELVRLIVDNDLGIRLPSEIHGNSSANAERISRGKMDVIRWLLGVRRLLARLRVTPAH